MKLSIIIPCFNNYNFTSAALKDLSKLPDDHEIIIFDNGSSDDTKSLYQDSRIKYIRSETNIGFSRANNSAVAYSSGDNLLFLNNDIRVRSNYTDWTKSLIESAEQGFICGPTGGLLTPTFEYIKETNYIIDSPQFYMCGWALLMNRSNYDKLNGWSEDFFAYFEDVDLSWRARELNIPFKIQNVPLHHFGRITGKSIGLSDIYTKSKEIFTNKWKDRI
jgi:GT2 family glycosyltransferase